MRPTGFAAGTVTALVAALAPAAPVPKDTPRTLAVSGNPAGNWDIFLAAPGGGEPKNLTAHRAADTEPNWSPDGRRIVFVSDRSGKYELWVMNADGSGPRQLTKGSGGGTAPRWSPDGKAVAFVSGKSGHDEVYTADAATGEIKQLTAGEFAARQAARSPDGRGLSYSYYGPARYGTRAVNPDGGGDADLTGAGGGVDADWSPDGKRVAFASIRSGGGFRVYTAAADGSDVRELSTADNAFGNVYPRWSPDGRRVAFGELVDGRAQVAVVGADGAGRKVLTEGPAHAFPKWSPDGRRVAFGRFEEGKPATLVVGGADGTNPREVFRGFGSAEWKPK